MCLALLLDLEQSDKGIEMVAEGGKSDHCLGDLAVPHTPLQALALFSRKCKISILMRLALLLDLEQSDERIEMVAEGGKSDHCQHLI